MTKAQESSRSLWNEHGGTVSEEFDQWKAVDADIRAFLRLTHRWSAKTYDIEWQKAQSEFSEKFIPELDDPGDYVDTFHKNVEGLWPDDYSWMVNAAALRDSVTAFEVYMEKSLLAVLRHHRWRAENEPLKVLQFTKQSSFDSPPWGSIVKVYAHFGIDANSEEVRYVRSLRHLLTHQRGELRTKEMRSKFAEEFDSETNARSLGPVRDVPLTEERVLEMMDVLASKVRETDPAPWSYIYSHELLPSEILDLTVGKKPILELVEV